MANDLFREEALAHYAQREAQGDVLRISPVWTQWTYWLLCAACAVGLLFAAFGSVHQYAPGPAVVRAEGRVDLTARAAGTVADVEVQSGQRVRAGQLLVRFYEAPEISERERIRREFDLLLVRTLRDPTDQGSRAALSTLRAQRELAESRLQERSVRAPRDGLVSDVRIRPGQHLGPGDVVLSLVGEPEQFTVLAMLPGHARPLLHPGQLLRLELAGFRYAYRELRIDSIGDEVVGPTEVRRSLPPEIADAVPLHDPVVLVRARLPTATFAMDGHSYRYHEGMQGTAEARVRTDSLLLTILPALRAVLPHE